MPSPVCPDPARLPPAGPVPIACVVDPVSGSRTYDTTTGRPRTTRRHAVCPKTGKSLATRAFRAQNEQVPDRDLIDRVVASTGLTAGEAARVVSDIVAYYRVPVEQVVRERHGDLQLGVVVPTRAMPGIGPGVVEHVFALAMALDVGR